LTITQVTILTYDYIWFRLIYKAVKHNGVHG